jgi:hypothetical protein
VPYYKPASLLHSLARNGGWFCWYCGAKLAHKPEHVTTRRPGIRSITSHLPPPAIYTPKDGWRMPERDHILAVSRGGTDALVNSALSCVECNRDKADRLVEEWLLDLIGEVRTLPWAGRKVIAFGSRKWRNEVVVREKMEALPYGITVVHGMSGKADHFIDRWARRCGHEVIPVPVREEDRQAAASERQVPILRNVRMLNEHPDADMAIGFWDGRSPGTTMMVNECRRRGLRLDLTVADHRGVVVEPPARLFS